MVFEFNRIIVITEIRVVGNGPKGPATRKLRAIRSRTTDRMAPESVYTFSTSILIRTGLAKVSNTGDLRTSS